MRRLQVKVQDGHAGADWYEVAYDEESWSGEQDFSKALPIRMPTMEPWDWENHWETGTLARCPSLDLTQIKVDFQITEDLVQRANDAGSGRIWIRLELQTFQGSWLNSTVSLEIGDYEFTYGPVVYETVIYNLTDLTLWDGYKYKEDSEYQGEIVSAPYLTIEIYDADPGRYFSESTDRYTTGAQTNQFAEYLPLIQDSRRQTTFRQAHLLDSTILGMNTQTDTNYLQTYQEKIDAYQAWIEEQNEKAKIENWGFDQWVRFFFAIGTFIISAIDAVAPWGSHYCGAMGMVLAIDQIQSMFTQRSMFSVVFSELAVCIYGSGKDWTAEQRQENKARFNVWTPFTFTQDSISKALNSLWSTLITLVMIYGPKMVSFIKSGFNPTLGFQDVLRNPSNLVQVFKGVVVVGVPAMSVVNQLAATAGRIATSGFHSLDEATNAMLQGVFPQIMKSLTQSAFYNYFWIVYRVFYTAKQVLGGFISPTEWFELAYYFISKGHDFTITINGQTSFTGNFVWNWGDNFYFLWLEEETTMGLFKHLGARMQNDFLGGTVWDNTPY